jgi:hypothetical protein
MKLRKIFLVVTTICLFSCNGPVKANFKVLNATKNEVQIVEVEVDGKHIPISKIWIPAGTAKKYSPIGHINGVSLSGGERIVVTMREQGNSTKASCVVGKNLEGICLVEAKFNGSATLKCWNDCETYISD